jgi:CheY-like chemotaxis protein
MTRVLIVDDDPAELRALQRELKRLRPDLTLVTCGNGAEATELMQARSFDLVLTDLRMPEVDGFQLLGWMSEHRPEVAGFSMSAHADAETAARATGLGAIEHFAKPLDPKLVLSRLSDTLAQSVGGHVQNVSLASVLQLLEMERKSCTLTVCDDDKTGTLVLQCGRLVAAQYGDVHGEAAAVAIVAWPSSSIAISRHLTALPGTVQEPLGFIVMEAMRLQDEAMRKLTGSVAPNGSIWPLQRRTFRPGASPSDRPPESARLNGAELGVPQGARAVAIVETATGNILRGAAYQDCPVGELARMASQLLLQEAATLQLCGPGEGVEELVLSTSSRCDVIRPLGESEFALLVFAPEDTNLVMARMELEQLIAAHLSARRSA